MKFYNRVSEIKLLREIELKSDTNAQFTVITGRRRIGKTQLILKALEEETILYFFVARKSEILLCKDFQRELQKKLKIPILGEIQSFFLLFEYLMEWSKSQKITLVIDEFQEFFSINSSIYSDMQKIWDLNHTTSKMSLIVSGSVFSLMHKIFQNNKEPLFGRAQHYIHLKTFDTQTLKTILADYNPSYKADDLLAMYSFTGGVAKYVQLLMDNDAHNKEKMMAYITAENSIFINEGKNMLIEEFGKDYAIYFSILSSIANGKNSRSEIENSLNKEIGGYLTKLENNYHLIKKATPIFRESKTKQVKYVLEDNFLTFWFRFIYKYSHMIEIGAHQQLKKVIERDYDTFTGIMLEKYFKTQAIETEAFTNIGGYWDRKGEIEIDFIAVNELEKKILVAGIKRNKQKIKLSALQLKMGKLLALYPKISEYEMVYFAWGLEDM